MTRFARWGVILILVAGCDLPTQKGTPPAPAKSSELQSAVFEELAQWVERGDCESSQRLVKVAGKALKEAGVTPPPGYDDALMPYLKENKPIDATATAAMLRKFK